MNKLPAVLTGAAILLLSACGGSSGNGSSSSDGDSSSSGGDSSSSGGDSSSSGGDSSSSDGGSSSSGGGSSSSGGGSSSSGGDSSIQVSTRTSTGGSIAPSGSSVSAGGTVTLTVTPNSGYIIAGVTGCGGTLSGSTYTTGTISSACTVTASFSPTNFTWESGSSTPDALGVYGTLGIAAITNAPGARFGPVSWTDSSGDLWMFGGDGEDGADNRNDLWKYSTSSGLWTWVGGSSTANATGVYGVRGLAAAANVPGARNSGASWTTDSGRSLWLFGGATREATGGLRYLNDLWQYSILSGEWTWVSGSSAFDAAGIYGMQGAAAATNVPGARYSPQSWTDSSGSLWLFGGYGPDSTGNQGYLNDLWKYSLTSGQWTWVSGSSKAIAWGLYGTQGVADAANVPGARYLSVGWTDTSGNLWLFGGAGYDSAGTLGYLNDLWKFSPASGQWTWMGGSSVAGEAGVYGILGVADATNMPGARDAAISWTDLAGNFWLFGGFDLVSADYGADLNDLWKYSPSSGQWTWVGGTNAPGALGVYGIQGLASGVPPARENSVSWTDAAGRLWLFGGVPYDDNDLSFYILNDLWMYTPQ